MTKKHVAVIGGGPAGLMAAEVMAADGLSVTVYERMANPARKFLLAGRGGLNLTHSEELPGFLARYGTAAPKLRGAIEALPPATLRAWCEGLGQPTFVGTSGRVFPKSMKASPLLRAWLGRLGQLGVGLERGTRWTGWASDGSATFESLAGPLSAKPDAVVLAMGGASWPRLGSDGSWAEILAARGVAIVPLAQANCGVLIPWSPYIREKFAGEPLKRIAVIAGGAVHRGEAVITKDGLEGGAVYAAVPGIRMVGELAIDLAPDTSTDDLAAKLAKPRGKQSLSNHLRKAIGLSPAAIALLHEAHGKTLPAEPQALAAAIKSVPFAISGLAPIARAISSAGGIAWDALDEHYMLRHLPGVFAAGEMLDWEAPTGGYLLQACFSTGAAAGQGVLKWLAP